MMCAAPRSDNTEARAILAPDQAATRAEKEQVQVRFETVAEATATLWRIPFVTVCSV